MHKVWDGLDLGGRKPRIGRDNCAIYTFGCIRGKIVPPTINTIHTGKTTRQPGQVPAVLYLILLLVVQV